MDRQQWTILVLLGGVAAWVYYQNGPDDSSGSDATNFLNDPFESISDTVVSSVAGWRNVGDAGRWLPALNSAEGQFGIPHDLLARIAYSESRFRPDIISGALTSSAGALGLMQLMPQYFQSVRAPRPFTLDDTNAQILEAAQLLSSDYQALGSWPAAVAAYNAGLTTIQTGNASAANKAATAKYVAAIIADVPAANA